MKITISIFLILTKNCSTSKIISVYNFFIIKKGLENNIPSPLIILINTF